jgi:hypothetical protein
MCLVINSVSSSFMPVVFSYVSMYVSPAVRICTSFRGYFNVIIQHNTTAPYSVLPYCTPFPSSTSGVDPKVGVMSSLKFAISASS